MQGHHLVMGELVDFLTGDILPDTHDERLRQGLARFLVEEKGYDKKRIMPRVPLSVTVDGKTAVMAVDFVVYSGAHARLVVKYGPGSLVTRYRSGLAAARLVAETRELQVVVTNGKKAHILDGATGDLLGDGMQKIPKPDELQKFYKKAGQPLSVRQREMESRILFAMEVDGACPCDDSICRPA